LNYSNFSSFVIASALDDVVGNSAIELGYQAGQSISELYAAVADSAGGSAVDTQVNQSSLLTSPYTLDLATTRELKQQLVSKNVLPAKNGKFMGAISPNVLGDIYNATTVNNSIN
jgi:triosephosphate isomerase